MEERATREAPSSSSSILNSPSSSSSSLGWAAFLATSWTWCIGMYLPVLLVRDFGTWAWAVFAIPNVIGAAALGWTISSPQASAQLVAAHRTACRWFSWVTITFQLYFAAWFVRKISPVGGGLIMTAAVAAIIYALAGRRGDRGWRLAAACVFAISLAAMLFGVMHHIIPQLPPAKSPNVDLVYLAVVCAFGFGLCPYLDLTFHRARQAAASPGDARLSFGIGFGVLFTLMILFTLAYCGIVTRPVRGPAAWMLLWHMSAQLGFTIAAHVRESPTGDRPTGPIGWGTVSAVVIAVGLAILPARNLALSRLPSGEFIYRGFMILYGLIFPAYVWICMLPSWRSPRQPRERSQTVFAIACILAAPLYVLAFIQNRMIALLPAVAIVLTARFVAGSAKPTSPNRQDTV